jgi:hypothetical protein
MIPQLELLVDLEPTWLSILDDMFLDSPRSKAGKQFKKGVIDLFLSIDKVIPREKTILFSANVIKKIISDTNAVIRFSEDFLKRMGLKRGKGIKQCLPLLRILRGLGLIEIFSVWEMPPKLTRYVGLTELGKVVREFILSSKGLSESETLIAMLLASLPFSTKMRIIYGLYYTYGPDYSGFYITLKDKLFSFDPEKKIKHYDGVERLGIEILYEIVLTEAGRSSEYISETQLLIKVLEEFLKLFNNDKRELNKLFKALNKYARYPHSNEFPYYVAAYDALESSTREGLDEILERYNLLKLKPLIEILEKKFAAIEHQLRGLYGLRA